MLSAHADIVGAWSHHVRVTEDLVTRALAMLGRHAAPGDVTRIDAGAGASAVFGLRDGGRHVVLKVTTVRRALAGAAVMGAGAYLGGHLSAARKVASRHPAYADAPAG